jgi:hypothetical protein
LLLRARNPRQAGAQRDELPFLCCQPFGDFLGRSYNRDLPQEAGAVCNHRCRGFACLSPPCHR